MRPLALTASVLVAITAMGRAADKPLHLTHDWRVSIGADGKVVALKDDGRLAKAVQEPVERAIRAWTFEPGKIDERPAQTETTLTLDLGFEPAAGDTYTVRVRDARVGGTLDEAASRSTPQLDWRDRTRLGLSRVVVRLDYDANGNVTNAEPQPDLGLNASRSLQASTVKVARRWKVDPERVGGHGVGGSLLVPVCYSNVPAGSKPPDFDCTFTPPGTHSRIGDGSSFALAPNAKLVSDVAGRIL